ncbi:penicillin acylase family protein [Ferruginivarius sediminum]|uniref:Penicillin acylase family protein n=1 Tax=Ferruginivarius sediminum TaxID=2661937 RepID=A0A369T8Z4_9PROT|nr:penicillin acylase family protein [Ferruginivarius sediminum]RDD60637.1 penicillin acylase family protein [Ferruginivarius sediminum]
MKRAFRWLLGAVVAIVMLAAVGLAGGYGYLHGSLPKTDGEIRLRALEQPVEVVRDGNGIPTIKAGSLYDAYTALGFLHAQDRLWQMDFMRRTAAGRLSEVVGEGTLGIDRFMRVMGFGRLAEEQLQHIAPGTRGALEAYSAGVNAFIDSDPTLPLEFQILGYEPEPWTAADSLSWVRLMAMQLSGNWRQEIVRARMEEKLDTRQLAFLFPDYPADAPTTVEEGRAALHSLPLGELASLLPYELQPKSASNAWIVSGQRTVGGKPILANDPHLGLQAPGYWYLARVETPEQTLVGATAPGLPFHILGRNEHLSWGLTTTHSDTQDLFIEKLAEGAPDSYITPDGPRPFDTRTEQIAVEGRETPVELTVRATRHGPVVSDSIPAAGGLASSNHVLALAWPALRADDRTPDAIAEINRAENVHEALRTMAKVHSPQQNVHLADDQGNIAVTAPARVPVRAKGDGSRPVPGWSGEYDWTGFLPFEALPRAINPPDGRIVNANNKVVPDTYPHLIAANWPPPWRAERIEAMLDEAPAPLDVDAMTAMQLDARSPMAEILLPTLLRHEVTSRRATQAMKVLRGWDGHMDRNEAAPLIFVAWMDFLNRALFADELGGALFGEFASPDPRVIRRAVEEDTQWCDDVSTRDIREGCAAQVELALEDALDSLEKRFGDLGQVTWGGAHNTRLPHPMLSRIPGLNGLFGAEIATDGGQETVNRGGSRFNGSRSGRYRHVHGAGLRAVHDMAEDPGSSLFMIADGQSGNPLSPHYANLAEDWRDGRYVKLVGDVQDSSHLLRLTPASR